MESLRSYLNSLASADQERFAISCGTSIGYLRKAISTKKTLNATTCALAELHSNGAVRRWSLRPDDWAVIWPELIGAEGAPPVPAETKEVA